MNIACFWCGDDTDSDDMEEAEIQDMLDADCCPTCQFSDQDDGPFPRPPGAEITHLDCVASGEAESGPSWPEAYIRAWVGLHASDWTVPSVGNLIERFQDRIEAYHRAELGRHEEELLAEAGPGYIGGTRRRKMAFSPKREPRHAVWHVDEPAWSYMLPAVHQALAGYQPTTLPTWPRRGDSGLGDDQLASRGYWFGAMYVMYWLIGWRRPDLGLKWFLWEHGCRDDGDQRLRLLRDVWHDNRQLELLAAWLWQGGAEHIDGCIHQNDGRSPARAAWFTPTRDELDALVGPHSEPDRSGRIPLHSSPATGGDDLELGRHLRALHYEPNSGNGRLELDSSSRRATLVVDEMRGWHHALTAQCAGLKFEEGNEWQVDVVAKPVGWLGSFRRSGVTGLWYSGPHATHAAGNDTRGS